MPGPVHAPPLKNGKPGNWQLVPPKEQKPQIAVGVDAAVHEELADVPLFVDGEANAEFDAKAFAISTRIAQETFDAVIDPRFANAGQRIPLTPVPGEDDEKFDDVDAEDADGEAAGCRVSVDAPSSLGLLVLVLAACRRRRAA